MTYHNKTKIIIRCLAFILSVLPASAVRAQSDADQSDRNGEIRVDVVVDMTEAGHKVAHPTAAQPAYYLPISVGYKEFGYAHRFQRPPPNSWEVQHALAKALYQEGYQLMTKAGHPSLVLVFWWGYLAPQDVDVGTDEAHMAKPGAIPTTGGPLWGPGQGRKQTDDNNSISGDGANATVPSFSLGAQNLDERQMLSMVAGNTIDDHQKYPDPRLDEVVQMTTAARYFVLISAFDFQSWLHHKPVLLWRAHVSTELWGHYFDQVVGALINTAGPMFGRETNVPHFITAPVLPIGRVIVGTPEVKGYPSASPPP